MSRSGYTDDCENLNLYRGTVEQAIRGKRGQALLRDLRTALDALPERKLIYGAIEAGGEVCALGAVGRLRGLTMPSVSPDDYGDSRYELAKLLNVAPCLAAEVQYINDEANWQTETPEQRFERVSKWVDANLRPVTPHSEQRESLQDLW